jgi:hypothetical protein
MVCGPDGTVYLEIESTGSTKLISKHAIGHDPEPVSSTFHPSEHPS